MKKLFYLLFTITLSTFMMSCATIIGGSKYYAHIKVPDHPNAKIEYHGTFQGTGDATIKVPRNKANRFSITIKEKNCKDQTFDYKERKFRGWAFTGTVVGWTGLYSGIPLPWGTVVDLSTGALWKPSIEEPGVSKVDFKNYNYILDYKGCDQ